MIRGVLRVFVLIAVLAVVGVLVVALLGGAFRFGVGVTACPVTAAQGAGWVPQWLQGGYEISLEVQFGEFVFDEASRLVVEQDAVHVRADRC